MPDFDDGLRHLLDEERHAVGPCGDLVEEELGHRLAPGDPVDDGGCLLAPEPVERQPGNDGVAAEAVREGRPGGEQDQDSGVAHAVERQLDQLQRRRVDPVGVLDHPQDRPLAGEADHLVDQAGEGPSAPLLRRQRQLAAAGRAVEAEQHRHQGRRLVGGLASHRLPHKRLQPIELRVRRVVGVEPDRPSEVLDRRVQGRIGVVGRALVADTPVRLEGHRLDERLGEPGLANSGLTGQQDHLALARLGLAPALEQQRQLGVAADQGQRRWAALRLETAEGESLAQDPKGAHRPGQAAQQSCPEVLNVEGSAKQRTRVLRHDHRSRLRDRLQSGGQVRGLAHDRRLGQPAIDAAADHDWTSRNSDPAGQPPRGGNINPGHSFRDGEARAHRLLGVVLVRRRPAEVDHQAIPNEAGAMAVEALDLLLAGPPINLQHLPRHLRVQPGSELGGTY